MTPQLTRTQLVVAVAGLVTVALVGLAIGLAGPSLFGDDRTDDPTTEGTVGYVEGYWYDDELAVDDRDDAAIEDEDELESVVYRSMARVEELRGLTFEDEVPVDVISREEFQDEQDDLFVELSGDERLKQEATFEALFTVDRDTDAEDEMEALYGDTVAGYYDPMADEIVLVSDTPDEPEVDEVVLGHELLHALQDQHFDLTSYRGETIDGENAENGLIEGDAVYVEREYDQRCGDEWECLPETDAGAGVPDDINWGLYLTLTQPYESGPDYVGALLEGDDWSAVDDAYDDPPESSSTVIHHEEREPAEIDHEDRSSDDWEPLEIDGEVATERVGEAAMVAMFGDGALDDFQPSVIEFEALVGVGGVDYDQPYTDGWAGDELITYVDADAGDEATPDEAAFVWETEWQSGEDATQFAAGYLELLEIHDAEAVDDRQDTYVVDDGYPGAYYLEADGETVSIVRAPSVDELEAVVDGAAPEGDDTLETESDSNDDADSSASLGALVAPGGLVSVSLVVATRRRVGATVEPDTTTEPGATAESDAVAPSPFALEADADFDSDSGSGLESEPALEHELEPGTADDPVRPRA